MDVATKAELSRIQRGLSEAVKYGQSMPELQAYIRILKELREKVGPGVLPSNEEIVKGPIKIGFQYGRKEFIKALTDGLGLPDPTWEIDYRMAIFDAVKKKDIEKVRETIEQARKALAERSAPASNAAAGAGAPAGDFAAFINAPIGINAGTIINYAASVGSSNDILKLLIDAGADINVINNISKTNAVFESVKNPDTLNFLIENGADLKVKVGEGVSLLYLAVERLPFELVKKIIDREPSLLNDYGSQGWYIPILGAIRKKRTDVLKYLIEKGARVDKLFFNHVDYKSDSYVNFAILEGVKDVELLKTLIKAGADMDTKSGTYQQTPILLSLTKGIVDIEWYKALIEGGANLAAVSDITGNGVLAVAMQTGDVGLFKFLLDAGAPINPEGSRGSLLRTAINSSLTFVKLLVEKGGVDINEVSGGSTHLTYALSLVPVPMNIVKFLLDSGADINLAPGDFGRNPLNTAIYGGKYEATKLLLERGAKIKSDSYGSPLITALSLKRRVVNPQGDFMKLLLDNGADINEKSKLDGTTALLYATEYAMNDSVVDLLNRGADPNISDLGENVPLVQAIRVKLPLEIIKLFLDKGADPSKLQKHPIAGQPPLSALDMAMLIKDKPVIDLLLEKGLDITKFPNIVISAIDYGVEEVVKRVIELGGDVNVVIRDGQTPLLRAIQMNMSPEIIKLLLDGGAKVNVTDSRGNSPISEAVRRNRNDLVPQLLEKLTDRRDKLFWAINMKDVDLVKKYLEGESDINAPFSMFDASPLWVAVYYDALNVVPILIEAGADIDLIFRSQTPLMVAAERGSLDMVKLLLEQGADPEVKIKEYTVIDFAKNDQVRRLLEKMSGRKWAGLSVADIQTFKDILKDPVNYAFCPICLQYTTREGGCMYMAHKCPVEGRHEKLHKLYVQDRYEGNTLTCTICGRICANHVHLKYAPPDATVIPDKVVVQNPDYSGQAVDCRSQGGGGVPEKIRRLQTLIETACELQSEIGKLDYTEARDRLIEAAWKGSQDTSITDEQIQKILTEKDVVPQKCKNTFSEVESREEVGYPNIKRPADEKALTPIKIEGGGPVGAGGGGNICFVELGVHSDNRPVYRFRHKQPNGSIYEHVGTEICAPDLQAAITGQEFSPKCPINPAECKGYLYPEELVGIMTPEFVNWYRRKFNEAMYKIKRERDAAAAAAPVANAAQQGGARRFNTIMQPMENPQCSFPSKGGNRRTYRALKNGRRRTYKS